MLCQHIEQTVRYQTFLDGTGGPMIANKSCTMKITIDHGTKLKVAIFEGAINKFTILKAISEKIDILKCTRVKVASEEHTGNEFR